VAGKRKSGGPMRTVVVKRRRRSKGGGGRGRSKDVRKIKGGRERGRMVGDAALRAKGCRVARPRVRT